MELGLKYQQEEGMQQRVVREKSDDAYEESINNLEPKQ